MSLHMSDLGYQCLILQVIGRYEHFQNGPRKIHDFSWNVLLHMVFLNCFWCVILLFNLQLSIYKCDIYDCIQDGRQKIKSMPGGS